METEISTSKINRPVIGEFTEPRLYLNAMLSFRRKTETHFSVLRACKSLRRVSPTLVTLVLSGKRKITLDRCEEFAKLLALDATEKNYFKHWIERLELGTIEPVPEDKDTSRLRKHVSVNLLNDWINVYVKDLMQIEKIRKNPDLLNTQLMSVASPQRIQKAFAFLLHEGYLRRNISGELVLDTPLAIADPQVPSKKIRQFHKGALEIAKLGLDLYPVSERLANTLTVPLNEDGYRELVDLIREFAEKLQNFAAEQKGERLYQVIINAAPVGGKIE